MSVAINEMKIKILTIIMIIIVIIVTDNILLTWCKTDNGEMQCSM